MSNTQPRIEILQANGPVKVHSYIVKLKPGTIKSNHLKYVETHIHHRVSGECDVTHPSWNPEFFNGYAGKFSGAALEALCHLDDIEYIEPDKIGSGAAVQTQTNAPWGLARLSQDARVVGNSNNLNFTYRYDATAGEGVDIYVLDTGVYFGHNDFGWRASWGANFVSGSANADNHGHGTHCAGTAVGTQFGVAKAARVIAVKVLADNSFGTTSDLISGINWATTNGYNSGRPCVMSLSLLFPLSTAINEVANTATSWGIHVVAAAGNENTNASNTSPASAQNVVAVGASNINDARWVNSNFGPIVDIFAPGEGIISCGITSPSSTSTMSGTSMATPHVSGLIAYLVGRNGNIPPAAMKARLLYMSTTNALTGIPAGTINALARNDQ